MSTTVGSSSLTLDEQFTRQFAGSAARFQEAVNVFPNGATHDGRAQKPFPLYIERAQGAHKWDFDGNCFIDFLVGHGALLLGHGHPKIVEGRDCTDAARHAFRGGTRTRDRVGPLGCSGLCPPPSACASRAREPRPR